MNEEGHGGLGHMVADVPEGVCPRCGEDYEDCWCEGPGMPRPLPEDLPPLQEWLDAKRSES